MDKLKELNLPTPDAIETSDIKQVYSRFINQLQVSSKGNVILSDPYFLSVDTKGISTSVEAWLTALPEEDKRKLILLSICCFPFDSTHLWPKGQPKFKDDPVVQLLFSNPDIISLAEEQSGVPFGIDVLPERRKVLADIGLKTLINSLPKKPAIETLSSEFIGGQPGNYGYQFWQVAEWSDDWAVVYGVTDGPYSEGYPFPWLLGFIRRNELERNFIELLRDGASLFDFGFYCTYGTVSGEWKLARLALRVPECDDSPEWSLIDSLLSLNDSKLECIFQEELNHDPDAVLSRVRVIHDSAYELDMEDLTLAEMLEKAGGGSSLRSIEEKIPEWEAEYENQLERKKVEREEALLPYTQAIETWLDVILRHESPKTFGWQRKRGHIQRFIEDCLLRRNEFPLGKHDFGGIRIGYKSGVHIGVIDFDEVASKIKRTITNED